jgi:hypothetical protein
MVRCLTRSREYSTGRPFVCTLRSHCLGSPEPNDWRNAASSIDAKNASGLASARRLGRARYCHFPDCVFRCPKCGNINTLSRLIVPCHTFEAHRALRPTHFPQPGRALTPTDFHCPDLGVGPCEVWRARSHVPGKVSLCHWANQRLQGRAGDRRHRARTNQAPTE